MNHAADATFEASYLESTRAMRPVLICFPYCNGDPASPELDDAEVARIHDQAAGR